jgi:hypothetical protein
VGSPEFLEELKNKKADHDGSYDPEGWQYAMDFTQKHFTGSCARTDLVRRRKWVRTCSEMPKSRTPEKGNLQISKERSPLQTK